MLEPVAEVDIKVLRMHPSDFCREDGVLNVSKVSSWLIDAGRNKPDQIHDLFAAILYSQVEGLNYTANDQNELPPFTIQEAVDIARMIGKITTPKIMPEVLLVDIFCIRLGYTRNLVPDLTARIMQIYRTNGELDIESAERFVTRVAESYQFRRQDMFNGIAKNGVLGLDVSDSSRQWVLNKKESYKLAKSLISRHSPSAREGFVVLYKFLRVRYPDIVGNILIHDYYLNPDVNPYTNELKYFDLVAVSNLLDLVGNQRLENILLNIQRES